MNILNKITALFQSNDQTTTKAPKFFLPETAERYEAIKSEILEKRRVDHSRILREVAESRSSIDKEVAEIKQHAVSLREEAKTLGATAAGEIKRREAERLEKQAKKRLEDKPNSPEVMQSRLKESMNGTIEILDLLAEDEARGEERKKVTEEGELLHFSHEGLRKVFFYRGKYFIWGCGSESYWMTDSLQQMSAEELQAVAVHEAKRADISIAS